MQLRQALRLSEISGKPIVALTGAGGKSSLLFRLGDELAEAGQAALLTATTRMWAGQADNARFSLTSGNESLLFAELPTSLRGYRQVLALAGPAGEPGKLRGLAPELICRLAALDEVAAAVVEADGSRERPLKAPAAHEPVVPSCATHMVVVAGMAALGQPLDAATVHRPEIAAELIGLQPGDRLEAEEIAALLSHPHGGLKGCPANALPLLYLNLAAGQAPDSADMQRRRTAGRRIASLVLAGAPPAFRAVLMGSAQAGDPVEEAHGRVAAVVLAAGAARRLESNLPKQLLPWQPGDTLAGRAVDIALRAAAIDEVIVVTGHQADAIQAALGDRPVRCVFNPDWQAGQSSSVAAGLQALSPDVCAAVFVLVDQPTVRPATIDLLVQRHRQTLAPVVAPIYQGGQRGNPVLFDRRTFPELLGLQGDSGGRALIGRYGDQVAQVTIDAPMPQGIETMADYQGMAGKGNGWK